jgi:hypothetical protein
LFALVASIKNSRENIAEDKSQRDIMEKAA